MYLTDSAQGPSLNAEHVEISARHMLEINAGHIFRN
jgi:hypothetical protein